jgi:beta-N-acetylhexosaminidase
MDELVNGCLLARFAGEQVPGWLREWLEAGLAGVVLFAGNISSPEQCRSLIKELASHNPRVITAVDEEGGIVTRLEARTGSSYPGNAALGAVDDTAATGAVARSIGAMLARSGVTLDLAPVADLQANPDNPVIGVRSFGADPDRVAAHTAAFVAGVQATGVGACAKHFPGHGRTGEDSHLVLPSVPASLADLAATDLVPFRAAISAGVAAVMTAHVRYPAVDDAPATLSRRWLTGVLRGDLAFGGVIVTDALDMAGAGDAAAGAVAALDAGADLLCLPSDPLEQRRVTDAVTAAVHSGALRRERIAQAAERVRALAASTRSASAPLSAADLTPGADLALGADLARRALRIRGVAGPLPGPPYVLDAGGRMSTQLQDTAATLLGLLRGRMPATEGVRLAESDLARLDRLVGAAAGRPLVLAVRDAHRSPWQREVLRRALTLRPDAVVVGTGMDYDRELAGDAYIGTLGASRAGLCAAADLLAGASQKAVPAP